MDTTTAEELADYIVKKCILDKHPVTNMQLQSILYCIQRDCLKKTGKPTFYNEFSAWAFGPVIPSIYYKYLGFGVEPIDFDKDICHTYIRRTEQQSLPICSL